MLPSFKRLLQLTLIVLAVLASMGAGDDARFNTLGHKLMCSCGCSQILLECNHVGCSLSERMRSELITALDRGDSDDLTLQGFVQKYGPTVLAAPTATGFDRIAWIMPYAALLGGIVLVSFIVRAWKNRPLLKPADLPVEVHGSELEHFRQQAQKNTQL